MIDKENGKPHVVKRIDHPHVRFLPEWFARGTLTRQELNDAAEELLADQAGLIVVGSATIEPALDKALAGTAKVVKRRDGGDDRPDHQGAARSVQRLTGRAPRDPPWHVPLARRVL